MNNRISFCLRPPADARRKRRLRHHHRLTSVALHAAGTKIKPRLLHVTVRLALDSFWAQIQAIPKSIVPNPFNVQRDGNETKQKSRHRSTIRKKDRCLPIRVLSETQKQ